MPLFELSDSSVKAFRRLNSSADVYEADIEALFWENLEAFMGEPLFALGRQARLPGGGIPDILALDSQGKVVVIEIKRDVDRSQLAQCLEYAGWARTTNLDELAGLYVGGPQQFFTDWQAFTGTPTPLLLDRVPRLALVARTFDARTDSALKFLREAGVPLALVRVVFYEDADGTRIVDVNPDEALQPPASRSPQPATAGRVAQSASPVGVTVSDLLDDGILRADEPISWRRPQLGQHYNASILANGEVLLADGRRATSLSTAANLLTGGNYNGWDCWTVPRLGGVKIGSLRTSTPPDDASPQPNGVTANPLSDTASAPGNTEMESILDSDAV